MSGVLNGEELHVAVVWPRSLLWVRRSAGCVERGTGGEVVLRKGIRPRAFRQCYCLNSKPLSDPAGEKAFAHLAKALHGGGMIPGCFHLWEGSK